MASVMDEMFSKRKATKTDSLTRTLNDLVDQRRPLGKGREKMADETYELDPYEEAEIDQQVKRAAAYQAKKGRQAADQAQQRIFAESLKEISEEYNLTEAEMQEVIGQCPFDDASKMLKSAVKQHLKNLASRSKHPKASGRERDKDGRFLAGSGSPAPSRTMASKQDSVDDVLKRLFPKGDKFLRR